MDENSPRPTKGRRFETADPIKLQALQLIHVLRKFLTILILVFAAKVSAQSLVNATNGSGIYGYKDTPKLPWSGYLVHDPDRPAPPKINPGPFVASQPPPSDAVVLFDGKDLSRFQSNGWRVVDGTIEARSGNLTTTNSFGSFQLHLEWMVPTNLSGHPFDRGNNGVLLMGVYEIQIFDSWNEKIYPDGQAAAIYGQTPPLVNACRPPGEWQSYDIIFTAPAFKDDKLVSPARVTMFHNGILVHRDEEIHGETQHRALPAYTKKRGQGPLVLYGHNCPVRFRNLWLRPL
jgi:hypothetical protein